MDVEEDLSARRALGNGSFDALFQKVCFLSLVLTVVEPSY